MKFVVCLEVRCLLVRLGCSGGCHQAELTLGVVRHEPSTDETVQYLPCETLTDHKTTSKLVLKSRNIICLGNKTVAINNTVCDLRKGFAG